jgi:hypothetical protein
LRRVYEETSVTLNRLGAVALDRATATATAVRGANHVDIATLSLYDKANALVRMGGTANLAAAVALYDRAIDIRTAALGADHLQTASTLHAKANALVQMRGSANLAAAAAALRVASAAERNTMPVLIAQSPGYDRSAMGIAECESLFALSQHQ